MEYSTLKIDRDADRIATVHIDVPERSMNVWNRALIDEFSRNGTYLHHHHHMWHSIQGAQFRREVRSPCASCDFKG